jgi:hypothetical protein
MRVLLAAIAAVIALLHLSIAVGAQIGLPHVELEDAPLMRLSGDVDSNSPAIWDRVFGRNTRSAGRAVARRRRLDGSDPER